MFTIAFVYVQRVASIGQLLWRALLDWTKPLDCIRP